MTSKGCSGKGMAGGGVWFTEAGGCKGLRKLLT